jgi:FkbM family methyltransferase
MNAKLVTRPPWHFRLATYLIRNEYRGGYRLISIANRNGRLNRVVRYRLPGKILFDVPIYRRENRWNKRDIFEYDPPLITDLVEAASTARGPVTFVDCGADIGLVSVLLVSQCPGISRVVAFEPNGVAFPYLELNMQRLPVLSQSWHAAVDAFHGTGRLRTPEYDSSDHSKYLVEDSSGDVAVMRMDELDIEPGGTVMIKLDVEGAELAALQGATRVLRQASEFIVSFEAHPSVVERTQIEPIEIIKFLTAIRPCRVTVSDVRDVDITTGRPFFSQIPNPIIMGYNVLCRSQSA